MLTEWMLEGLAMPIVRQQQRAAAIVSALAILVTAPALAHTRLTASTPSDGASVVGSPSAIVLAFSEPVHVTAVSLETADGAGSPTGDIPDGPAESFAIPVSGALAPGMYVVRWRAVSADTHIVSGEFGFTVAETAADTSPDSDGSVSD